MDLPVEIKEKIAKRIETIPLGSEGSIYNWAQEMYKDIFGNHHLGDFPELKEARSRDKRMTDDG